ncbi:MAG: DUF2334 domain-containing protein [Myxococcales bacterium]|nr:DUF2334 domain-containing protein [Myxococcales bacterium]
MPTALISLHDVTPAHAPLVFEALGHLRRLGVDALTLLVVPDFHGHAPLDAEPAFCRRLQAELGPRDELQLHGYTHLADAPHGWRGRWLTAGEGEFLDLDGAAARERLQRGLAMMERAFGVRPSGFVAPAWLDNAAVRSAALDLGLNTCEDHFAVYDLAARRKEVCPALSFASRSVPRHLGSLAYAAVAAPVLARRRVVRLAVHPLDYGKPSLIEAIARVVRRWRATHRPASTRELFA